MEWGAARVIALGLVGFLLQAILRLSLLVTHWSSLSALSARDVLELLYTGTRLDGVIIGYLLLPACLLLLVSRRTRVLSIYAWVMLGLLSACWAFELAFFEFYGFRANYLVLEHGTDPEVLRMLSRAYALQGTLGIGLVFAASLFVYHWLVRALQRVSPPLVGVPWRMGGAVVLLAGSALMARGTLDHRPLNPSLASVTSNRVANEVAGSGLLNVTYEASRWGRRKGMRLSTHHEPLSGAEAHERVRRLLGTSGRFTDDSANPFVRSVEQPAREGRPLNVVLVVMESFTGRLVGALGGSPALSPEIDALAREGLLLTHCYSTGERTVQGLEALVSSFPPLPGVSVLRRPEAQHGFETLGSAFERRGYDTLFMYGGQGIFDHMRSFFLGNGFQFFIEERDFQQVSFRGSWGVSDGDLYARANREFQSRWERGVPFFATLLTVSFHSPWEFPPQGVPPLPAGTEVPPGFERDELANFLYADFAVGEFVRSAQKLPYFADTLFVFVGDHGVHLRGRELLPAEEYRVPAVFYSPGRVAPERMDAVTSQLDIPPTILGIVGGDYRSTFFGRDVLRDRTDDGIAILIYNKRRYGVRREGRLTVLKEGGGRASYQLNGADLEPVEHTAAHEEDARDGLAVVQVAEELVGPRLFTTAPLSSPPARSSGEAAR